MNDVEEPSPPSPCLGICLMDPQTRMCRGCLRTIDEICTWYVAGAAEKRAILARLAARRKQAIGRKLSDLFQYRYLFVQKHLSVSERARLRRLLRGLPQPRLLRVLMEEVYRLFDRRCRMATALTKLTALRARLRRFRRLRTVLKRLLAPGLEKALVFLDERLLGSTSNAVERSNRRYRKMRKTVYRVRTQKAIEGRLALDLLRESRVPYRVSTTKALHKARAA